MSTMYLCMRRMQAMGRLHGSPDTPSRFPLEHAGDDRFDHLGHKRQCLSKERRVGCNQNEMGSPGYDSDMVDEPMLSTPALSNS